LDRLSCQRLLFPFTSRVGWIAGVFLIITDPVQKCISFFVTTWNRWNAGLFVLLVVA
jgi:hypothetical protein